MGRNGMLHLHLHLVHHFFSNSVRRWRRTNRNTRTYLRHGHSIDGAANRRPRPPSHRSRKGSEKPATQTIFRDKMEKVYLTRRRPRQIEDVANARIQHQPLSVSDGRHEK